MTKNSLHCLLCATLAAIGITAGSAASAAPVTWIGGNTNWDATITKWNPNDEPDSDDEAIFNTPNTVNLANATESIMALTMSGGIDLLLNGNDLTVDGGNITLSGASTLLDVPTNSLLNTDDVFVNAGASLTLHGGTLTMVQAGGDAVLTVAAGGAVGGYGTINSNDAIAAANTTVLSMAGNLTVTTFDLFSAQAGTLSINVPANGRVDIDQVGSVVDITRNDTLDINGAAHDPAVDAYGGTMNFAEGATLDMSNAWGMNGGSINVNTNGINVNTAGAAATIAGGTFTQTGGTINLADNLDSLRFSAPFGATGGTINNNGLVIFDADGFSVIDGADFQMNGASASITVTDGPGDGINSITIRQGNFDLGGAGNDASNVTTVGTLGAPGIRSTLNIYMDFDSGAGDVLDQRIELNGGNLNFVNEDSGFAGTDTTWHLSGGVLNANSFLCSLDGSDLIIQAETINVANDSSLFINTSSVEITNPTINIMGGLVIDAASRWTNSAVSITGDGVLSPGIVTIGNGAITADVVWDVSKVYWDLVGPTTIDPGSSLTINADTIDNVPNEGYDSTLTINSSDLTVDTPAPWRMDGVLNIENVSAVPTINGARMIVGDANGATVNVGANGGSGVHDMNAPLTLETNGVINIAAGATFQVDGDTIFNGGQVTGGGNYAPASTNTVNADTTIDVSQFNFDRGSWTINTDATLSVQASDYDSDSAIDSFNSTITLNGGVVSIALGVGESFVVNAATINMVYQDETPKLLAVRKEIGNDTGMLDTHINVSGPGLSQVVGETTFFADADVNINSGSILLLDGPANFNPVNGVNNASFTGDGYLWISDTANFNEVTTLNFGSVNLNSFGDLGHTVTLNADVTINVDFVANFGPAGPGAPDILVLNGQADLTVNLTDPDDDWQIGTRGVVNINASGDPLIGSGIQGSDVNVLGTVNVSGNSEWNARVDLAGTVNTTLAGDLIRFTGGSLADPNRLVGGTITGPGTVGALNNDALVGFGTIGATIDFDDNAELLADDGALHVNGTIADVGTIGTNDSDGILNVTNPWNTNQADTVFLEGGELRGAPVTVSANGIRGHGLVIAQVLNGGRIQAEGGGLLIVQHPGNINDWDGAGAGQLNALTANLEIRDNAAFPFTGSVSVAPGRNLFVNGFELEFEPGSTLSLDGGTFRSSHATHIGGTVTVVAGGSSTLQIAGTAVFENGSSTSLDDDLLLNNPTTVIQVGADFAGGGSLVNTVGNTLQLLDGVTSADLAVFVKNEGVLALGAAGSAGTASATSYQQVAGGIFHVDLGGTGSGQSDRLTIAGQAMLSGTLELSLLAPYVPSLGNIIPILSAVGGLDGTTFVDVIQPATMPVNLIFDVIYNPTNVQLVVVSALPGDYNLNGVVDAADYIVWRKGIAPLPNEVAAPLGVTDSADYDAWRARFGNTSGSGSGGDSLGGGSTVPEPATWLLLIPVAAGWCLRRGRAA